MMRVVRRLTHILFTMFLLPSVAWSSSPDLYGFGARAVGTAGATASHTSGFEAVYHNPAGLAFERRPSVSFGYLYGQSHLRYEGSSAETPPVTSTLIGFALPLPFGGALTERLSLGAGFVIPTNTVLTADLPQPGTPNFTIVGNRAQTVTLQAALALKLSRSWSIGAGVIALSSLEGAIDVAPNAEGRVGSSARDQLVASYAPIIGTILRLPAQIDLGIVYRGASAARFSLPLTADLGDGFSIPIPQLQIEGVAQYDPQQVEVEIGWSSEADRISANISWNDWSRFPQPIIYAAAPADMTPLPEPGFVDTIELAVGIESQVGEQITLRGGYRWVPSPIPTKQTVHAHLDSRRHVLAVGSQISWSRLYLATAAQLHYLETGTLNRPDGVTTHDGVLWSATLELGVNL